MICPYCKSDNVEDTDDGTEYHEIYCIDCGACQDGETGMWFEGDGTRLLW